MVVPPHSLLLSKENIDCLFPFHLLIDKDMMIESCGNSMKKLHHTCMGKVFTDCFEFIRPVEPYISFEVLCTLTDQLVLFSIRNSPDAPIILKGQFIYMENDQQFFFTGTPWFNSVEDLRATGLMMNDFPYHDPTVDLLHLIKAQEIINQDLNQLVSTINEQKNKLKIGETQILSALLKERELNQLKSNFISLASHEFRTPLACIRSSTELLQVNGTQSEKQLKNTIRHQNNILLQIDYLTELMDEVLIVGRIESNMFTCNKKLLNLRSFLKNLTNSINQLQDDDRSVTFAEKENSRQLMADPLLLKHILNNLLSNALKYSKEKKAPVLTVVYDAEYVTIHIIDFGIGIPLSQQVNIFQAFFRAENTNQIAGTGLGLFITKNFVDLHGGNINFISTPDVSTEFMVSLPLN